MSKPVCIFQSPMWTRSGYGDLGMALAKSLLRYDKFELLIVPTRWGGCSRKFLASDVTDPVEKELFNRILKQPLTKQPEVFMQCTIPNEFQPPAKFNIGVTAGIETTMARPDWIDGLNRMNMNIVTSEHAKKVFVDNVYKRPAANGQPEMEIKSLKPMETLFWGADLSIYGKGKPTEPRVEEEMAPIKEDFCFLFVGQWTSGGLFSDRKDIGNLTKVFLETFAGLGPKPKPALILKTSGAAICNMDKYDMINRLKAVRQMVESQVGTSDLPNVYIMYGDLTEPEMNALYNHPKVRAHVSFTHGEGFGHPLLLSTLSGKPMLVSNWSGHLDFLDDKMCKLLDGKVDKLPPECCNEWLLKDTSWFTVDYQKASVSMKNCFYNYGAFLTKGEELRVRNEQMFSNAAMDAKFHAMLDKYVPKFATESTLVLPKLKKVGPAAAPATETETKTVSGVTLNLPKLKRVTPAA